MKITGRKILVMAMVTILILGFFGVLSNDIVSAEDDDQTFLGLAAHSVRNSWEDLYAKAFNWYCQDKGIQTTWTEAGYDASTQITQAKRMIDMGIDGLIISPWNVKALRVVMKYAQKNDVPVICTNTAVDSSYPLMFIGYGAKRGGRQLGEKIVKYLKNKVEPIGEVKGTVLELSSGPGTSEDVMRGGGFHQVVDKYKDIKVIKKIGKSDRAQSKSRVESVLRSGKEIDAVFAQNGSMALGASSAFKSQSGISPEDIFIATVDAFPAIIDEIKAGNIDVGLDQPPAFYNPIAVHYMVKYLKNGKSALPEVGKTITTDDLTIRTGKKHMEVDPWAKPIWAPAKIKHATEYSEEITNDHIWFQTNSVFVTKENADSPLLWGNFPLPGW